MNYIAPRAEPLIREIPLSRLALAPENVRKTPPDRRADAELSGAATNAGRPWPARNAVRRQSPPSGLSRGGAGRWPSRPLGPSPPARRCPVEVMAAHGVARFARRLQSAVFPGVQGTCSCLDLPTWAVRFGESPPSLSHFLVSSLYPQKRARAPVIVPKAVEFQTPDIGWLLVTSSSDCRASPVTYLSRSRTTEIHDSGSTPHFSSKALALGESLPMIGKLLGHTQVQTTARYALLANESVKASGSRVSDSIGIHVATNRTRQ